MHYNALQCTTFDSAYFRDRGSKYSASPVDHVISIGSPVLSAAEALEALHLFQLSTFFCLNLGLTFVFFFLRVKMLTPNTKAALTWVLFFVPGALSAAVPVKRAISSVVSGSPIGFASGATGGGDATPVYPTTIDELKKYLTSKDPQVIVVDGEYNFAGSEGTQTEQACNTYSCTPENGGQGMLNTLNGCTTSTYDVEIDTAGIQVQSDKTLVGKNGATLNGTHLSLPFSPSKVRNTFIRTMLTPRPTQARASASSPSPTSSSKTSK
jgi:hypothetical protein